MYISNSSNIGMATLLQKNKNCMKTLTNGTSVVGVGTAGTNHIVVGNVNAQTVGQQTNHQVGIVTSSNVPTQTVTTSSQGASGGSNTINSLGGNLVLPAQTQTILLTNGATGATTILSYQQYQQLLQQQQQQQQQRLLASQNLVNLPIGNLINSGSGGLTVITDSTNNHNVSSSGNSTSQGTFLVASSSPATTVASSSVTSSFQQQFQQQIANLQSSHNVTTNTSFNSTTLSTPSYLHQSGNQQQKPSVGNVVASNNNNTTTIRHFSQFSQQQPANTVNVVTNTSASSSNSQHQQQQRTTTVLINRNNNTIIAGNTTQRLQHATILTKSPANLKTSQPQHQGTIMVNNMAVQQVINNSNGQIISLVKTPQQQQQQQINKNIIPKSMQQTTTANLPKQQLQKQRFGTTNIQQVKHQQLKVVAANNQAIPQRATIINSNTLTKNNVLSTSNINSINATKLVNLNKTSTANTTAAPTISTTKHIFSNSLTCSQKQIFQQQQINGHQSNLKLTNLQQQPASKLVPNGLNTNNKNNTNINFVKSSSASAASSSSSNTIVTSAFSLSNTPTIYNIAPSTSALTNPNTSFVHTSQSNSQHQYTTLTLNSTAAPADATTTITTTAHNPSNAPSTDSKSVSIAATTLTTAATANNSSSMTANDTTAAAATTAPANEQEPEPEIDIVINNVVCSFSVRCHLNLREIALNGANVEYRRENGMVTMKLRRPYTTASIWSSGRITCTGATSEEQAKIAARRYSRCLQKLGFRARFNNFRVVNVLGTCSMPWAIKIVNFSEKYREAASYEPELHPGVTYKLRYPKATLKIFSTGSITVTAASVAHVQCAIEHIFPLVYEFRKKRSPEELEQLRLKQLQNATFEDITETEDTVLARSGSNVLASSACESVIPTVSTLHRRRVSKTFSKFPIAKRKHIDDNNEEFDADDPEYISGAADNDEDIVLYDPNEIIEGPDCEDDL